MAHLMWQRAAAFAARAHQHQYRKDGATPFFSHPVRVALTLMHVFECHDEVAIAAALLHDTIEDTKTDYDDVQHEFGTAVADSVSALTKNMLLPERLRERDYDRRLAAADWRARLIKLADQYDNFTDAFHLGTKNVRKTAAKCRRAIALATADSKRHPETRRAIAALRKLMRTGR
jgi:guanosine-3',5'-bis(diphosphate) 3'-pyrophosphohydrolase